MKKLSEQLRDISTQMMQEDKYPCCDSECSCIMKEEKRPLTKSEKSLGWSRRPFNAYVADNMCLSCSVYWYASMAANNMHRLECIAESVKSSLQGK